MLTFKGIPASSGIAFGEALVIDNAGTRIKKQIVDKQQIPAERERYLNAFEKAKQEVVANAVAVTQELGESYGLVFYAYRSILEDSTLNKQILEKIEVERYAAPCAISTVFKQYAEKFHNIPNEHLAQRALDIQDLESRLMQILVGVQMDSPTTLNKSYVVLAHNLTPSETANFNRNTIQAFVTEIGGKSSHTSILAQALEIPAVVGAGRFLDKVKAGQTVIVDGNQGALYIDPTPDVIEKYKQQRLEQEKLLVELKNFDSAACTTKDNYPIQILGNIALDFDAKHCLEHGADGIGLYRTEFLYMTSELQLDEEIHFQKYREVIQTMKGKPVTIRTYDLGADKILKDIMPDEERNPALGLRSIRLSLAIPQMFRIQLRAILRASVYGPVRILFPMVSTLTEWRRIKMMVHDTFEDLDERGDKFDHNVPLGIMVEVPSTVMMIEEFLNVVDFISIGTNDLIQYTLATDRTNKNVAHLFDGCEPAIIKLIWKTVTAANKVNKPVSLCGQMASDPLLTMLLLGLGLRSLSMPSSAMRDVKQVCSAVTMLECRETAFRAMKSDNASDIRSLLKRQLATALPERYRMED